MTLAYGCIPIFALFAYIYIYVVLYGYWSFLCVCVSVGVCVCARMYAPNFATILLKCRA